MADPDVRKLKNITTSYQKIAIRNSIFKAENCNKQVTYEAVFNKRNTFSDKLPSILGKEKYKQSMNYI